MPPCAAEKAAGAGCGCQPPAAVAAFQARQDGKAEALFYDSVVPGATLQALQRRWTKPSPSCPSPGDELPARNRLRHGQLLPGWTSVNFVRPAHGLVALHGSTVVPVKALGLTLATAPRPPL